MRKNIVYNYLLNISDFTFFALLLIFQLIFLFQGFDFTDEGCHAAFYQQIFAHPETMVGNFMYWFSGIVGGCFYYFFSDFGLLGLRFQGLIVNLSTMAIAYYLLKNYVNLLNLRIAIFLIFVLTTNEIKEMHYDTLTALINLSSAYFLFQGLRFNKYFQIALSGALISLSMFTRLPSIVMLVFFLAIIYNGMINKLKVGIIIKQTFILFMGFFSMTLLVLLVMKLIGHLPIYIDALKMVFNWGSSTEDSHSILRLIKLFINDYSHALLYGFMIIFSLFILNFLYDFLSRQTWPYLKIIKIVIHSSIILSFIGLIITNHINSRTVISVFSGIALIMAILILLNSNYAKEVKLLVFLSCLIVFFEPLGSAGGIGTSGRHSLWLIFPLAIDFIFNLKKVNVSLNLFGDKQEQVLMVSTDNAQLDVFRNYFIGFCFSACVYFTYYYPYFDMSDRIYMTEAVNNKNTIGIYTTKERASVVNELLTESSKYIKKGDYVLAYDCMPMYHYLTETLPYLPNTWPWIYVPKEFEQELIKSKNKFKELPVVIIQKVNTLASNWPQNYKDVRPRSIPDIERDSILNNFMTNNNYSKIWENIAFEIRVTNNQ